MRAINHWSGVQWRRLSAYFNDFDWLPQGGVVSGYVTVAIGRFDRSPRGVSIGSALIYYIAIGYI